ncbi:response regulator [Desulfopila aestuarii]|uniref:histidine kinase n=1 Tax=Desulfopila aestuarii DSM 18488 TaxID=1121416 RepID=A0A1M7YIZ2_9BACT|nr:response regulator [Desulfopila aestuarii]SHO52498.1 His Kinase A (phospho-acceptor) domain-containing protein [Desulfopila aestuarii DSM 18488]
MVELLNASDNEPLLASAELLDKGEAVVIVDDSPEVVLLLNRYLENQGFTVFQAGSAAELYTLLETSRIALVLLDIGLPDRDGNEVLHDIVPKYPDLGIIMVTGTTDLSTALDCLRLGADDYLTKPVTIKQFSHIVRSTLKKRRLAIDNRKFQSELESTNYRTQFLHALNLKMNSVYLSTVELKGILQAILVGITSEEGLKFNRAFLALYNEETQMLEGRLAIGPATREDASRVWESIKQKDLHLQDIITHVQSSESEGDVAINRVARQLNIPITESNHVLVAAGRKRQSIMVVDGYGYGYDVPEQLLRTLDHDTFIVVPLYSPSKSLGVIIVDNFVTRKKISQEDILTLEIFASQASLAIEHSHLYEDMRLKIRELELVTQELERSKDLLVASERYSAVGHMSAQLVHVIRNPITSIGGTARLLAKKTDDDYIASFLNIITREAAKIESTLEDLFSFVEDSELSPADHQLYPLIRRSVMIFYATMKNANITYQLDLPGESPIMHVDATKMRQVFLHLVKNGIEAMPNGGTLKVSCQEKEHTIEISINDTGSGISDNNLRMAADPFFTTKTYGTGMGLTLVQKITEMHDATFALQHNEGGGMTAIVKLPKSRLAAP